MKHIKLFIVSLLVICGTLLEAGCGCDCDRKPSAGSLKIKTGNIQKRILQRALRKCGFKLEKIL